MARPAGPQRTAPVSDGPRPGAVMAPDLVRNYNSEVVHRASCSSRGGSTGRWRWAQHKTLADISEATRQFPWLHLCRTCLPGVCACGRCAP